RRWIPEGIPAITVPVKAEGGWTLQSLPGCRLVHHGHRLVPAVTPDRRHTVLVDGTRHARAGNWHRPVHAGTDHPRAEHRRRSRQSSTLTRTRSTWYSSRRSR